VDGGSPVVTGGLEGVADGLVVVTGGLTVVTRAGDDSDDPDSGEPGLVCMLMISPGCVELQGAVLKLKIGLVETRFAAKR
jgi:hypothetical protein